LPPLWGHNARLSKDIHVIAVSEGLGAAVQVLFRSMYLFIDILESQLLHKTVNLMFYLAIVNNTLTILWKGWLSKTN
jgi:hypothetical protein